MHTKLGSSKKMVENLAFSAILSNKEQRNPGMDATTIFTDC